MPIRQSAQGTLAAGITIDLGAITVNTQNFSGTATWNNSGVTFTALKLNITDTASNSSSLLMDLQVGGTSKLSVDKTGALRISTNLTLFSNGNISTGGVATLGQVTVPAGTINYMGAATGLVNVMAVTSSPVITAYTVGAFYLVQANITNTTTTPTLNINSLGAKTIVKRAATALAAGDYVANMMCLFVYDGTNMELLNPVVN